MANIKAIIPPPATMVREVIIVTVGVLGAAWIISRFPGVQQFVQANSLTVRDQTGNVLY